MGEEGAMSSELNEGKIAELICNEPLLYKGLTTTELTGFAVTLFAVWSASSFLLILIVTGSFISSTMALPVGLILAIVSTNILAGVIHRFKRNKPDGHYEQQIMIFLKKHKLANNHLIVEDQIWEP